MGNLKNWMLTCIENCKTAGIINTQNKAEVLLCEFADELDKNGAGGGGMPAGEAPYQQLVTDGNGEAVWEERLAYESLEEVVANPIVWDGSTDGLVTSTATTENDYMTAEQTLVRITPSVPTLADIAKGGTLSTRTNGILQTFDLDVTNGESVFVIDQELGVYALAYVIFAVPESAVGAAIPGLPHVFEEPGLYMTATTKYITPESTTEHIANYAELSLTDYAGFITTGVVTHTIDPKFLPPTAATTEYVDAAIGNAIGGAY